MMELLKKYKEILAYLFWGGMTTVVSWVSYSLFTFALPLGDYTIVTANILSWVCAVLFAFFTNKLWVFGSKCWAPGVVFPELWKFTVSRLATGVVEMLGVPLLVKIGLNQTVFGIEGMVSKMLVSIVVIILNYIFSKLLVFKKN